MCGVVNPVFGDLELILEALNEPSRYRVVIAGATDTGKPELRVSRMAVSDQRREG
jgi:hypothetical protein